MAEALRLEGFGVRIGDLEILKDVNLTIAEGEFVALLGPSGVGKSTLLHAVVGLLAHSTGQLQLFGEDVPKQRRLGRVGLMAQRDLLLPWLTVEQNVALGITLQGVGRRDALIRVRPLLSEFGLAGFETSYPAELSGGMRQRAALLRTLLGGQPFVALDEPFGALDSITRTRLWLWLQERLTHFRRTVLLVTHDVDEALFLADRVLVLGGRPAGIETTVTVALERPRRLHQIASQEIAAKKLHVLETLGLADLGAGA